jgi:hypothetical protein
MNIKKYEELMAALPERGDLMQENSEWFAYLEFISAYFKSRKIVRPLIVEIGIYRGATRAFYEQLLGAEYICIDINPDAHPDIVGDTKNGATYAALIKRLGFIEDRGRRIDLLFIDGDHKYEAAKLDYERYSPLARHLVVLHDVIARRDGMESVIEVFRLWEEIVATESTLVFKGPGWVWPGKTYPCGVGIIFKDGKQINGEVAGIGVVLKERAGE